MASIPLISDLSKLMRDALDFFGGFWDFAFETKILDWLSSLSEGDNLLANMFASLLSSIVNIFFTVFNIPSDTTIASFFLFAGLILIFAVWILNFFLPFV